MSVNTPFKTIWTIGHSTRSFQEFSEILDSNKIQVLVDVRRFPGSGRFPHFNKENLEVSLPECGIAYVHFEALGGRRKTSKNSKNSGWRLASFRGYADYMETEEFAEAVKQLQEIATEKNVAYMCSEAVWWSCHRSLISDYLKVRDWKVLHIMNAGKTSEHPFTKPAKIVNEKLFYTKEDN